MAALEVREGLDYVVERVGCRDRHFDFSAREEAGEFGPDATDIPGAGADAIDMEVLLSEWSNGVDDGRGF